MGVLFDHLPFLTPKAGEWWDDAVCFLGFFSLQQVKIQVKEEEKSKRKKRWANEETTIYCYVAMVLMMSLLYFPS